MDPVKDLSYTEIPSGSLPIASGVTTIPVDDASRLPDPATDSFEVTIYNKKKSPGEAYLDGEAEIVLVTAESANNLTVTRAQAGTTAITFVDTIEWAVIAGFGTRILSQIVADIAAKASLSGDSSQTFSVAPATSDEHAVRRAQVNQRVILPEAGSVTDNLKWYRVAQYSRANRNSIALSVIGANRILTTTSPDEVYISVENFTGVDPIIKYYTKNLTPGTNAGRVVVTNDGTTIGIYARVGRYGPATVSAQHFVINNDSNGTIEATEIGTGAGVPAGISSDVVYDTYSDAPDASMGFGSGVFTGTVTADDYITTSRVESDRVDALAALDNISEWKKPDGSIDYKKHYAYKPRIVRDEKGEIVSEEPGLSMETRVAMLEKMVSELIQIVRPASKTD